MKNKLLFFALIVFLLSGCSAGEHYRKEAENEMSISETSLLIEKDSMSNYASSTAAVETKRNDSRRFIRTVNMRFKAKNTLKSTYAIEEITVRNNGFVANSTIKSDINRVENTDISNDSSLVSTFYTISSSLTLRVPNVLLDTTLKEVAKQIDFLDYRSIKANDVSLDILANNLAQNRLSKNEERISSAIDKRGGKLNETTAAEEMLLQTQEYADQFKINNLLLEDQISFSTINLTIYQDQTVKRELIARIKNIEAYKPGVNIRLVDALDTGGKVLMDFLISLVNIWPVFLTIAIVLIIIGFYRKIRNNRI